MTAYYNEIDRFNCDWLSNLMDANVITPGKIDDRSIVDVRPDDVAGFERVHFFAGVGGWDRSLNIAGWFGPVWTGSCPCQPFSLAGAQKGFDDARHLWPEFKRLIAKRRPATVFGEQVASASQWLRLVRGDLEALGYAMGCLPIQAASAGADHIRDRYWFVADAAFQRGQTGISGSITRHEGNAGILDDRRHEIRVADADQFGACEERKQRGRQQRGTGGNPSSRDSCDVGNASGTGAGRDRRSLAGAEAPCSGERLVNGDRGEPTILAGPAFDWIIGADGKARRVKPGIRLLAHGVPNRVGLLRGFGNAIDPRPAAEFIGAFMSHQLVSSQQHSPTTNQEK